MSELHSKLISDIKFVPDEGQRDLECSNKESHRCPSFGLCATSGTYSNEELGNISDLCSTLKNIRARLIREGVNINEIRNRLYEQR